MYSLFKVYSPVKRSFLTKHQNGFFKILHKFDQIGFCFPPTSTEIKLINSRGCSFFAVFYHNLKAYLSYFNNLKLMTLLEIHFKTIIRCKNYSFFSSIGKRKKLP